MRIRLLWIAVLSGVTAAAVLVILLSDGGDGPRVTPLREQTARETRGSDDQGAMPYENWHFAPAVEPPAHAKRRPRAKTGEREGRRHELQPLAKRTDRTSERRTRPGRPSFSGGLVPVGPPVIPAMPPAAPAATPAPVPVAAPPAPAAGVGPQPAAVSPGSTPPGSLQEIRIEQGRLAGDLDRVRPQNGHLRLQVLSDEFVVVTLDDSKLAWPVLPGVPTLIEFNASTKSYELELKRRKGSLVLNLDD
jgi:hypothetical protein